MNPVTVDVDQAHAPTYMIIKDDNLATRKSKIQAKLSWHVVCGEYEMQTFQRYDMIKNYRWSDSRHEIFDRMRWPNHTIWSGGWGKEPLYYNKEPDLNLSHMGIVWCTDRRAEEIRLWIRDQIE